MTADIVDEKVEFMAVMLPPTDKSGLPNRVKAYILKDKLTLL